MHDHIFDAKATEIFFLLGFKNVRAANLHDHGAATTQGQALASAGRQEHYHHGFMYVIPLHYSV